MKMDEEAIKERIRLIPDGVPFKEGNITIRTSDSDKLIVTGWISTFHFENFSKEKILQELEDLKNFFSELSDSYNEIEDLVNRNNLSVEFHVTYDDAGKVGIGLCSDIDGKLNWYV